MAKKPKTAPLLFPLTVKGKKTEVERKVYKVDRASQLSKELKITLTDKQVDAMIKAHAAGEELAGENIPKEMETAFEKIGVDYEAAKESQEEAQELLNKEFEEEQGAKEKQAALEKEVFEAALVPVDEDELDTFNELFTCTENSITVAEEATTEQIAQKLVMSLGINEATAWYIGDLGNILQDRGVEGAIDAICDKFDKKSSTVYKNMLIARRVPAEQRDANLSLTVYDELVRPKLADSPEEDAKIKAGLIKAAAKQAKKGSVTAVEARAMADSARTIKASTKGNNSSAKAKKETPRYLVAVLDDVEGESYLTDDVTGDEIKPNFVIDLETMAFAVLAKSGAVTWTDLTVKLKEKE